MPYSDKDPRIDLGELMVSLAYLPSAERLTVVIIKARNLRVIDDTRSSSGKRFKNKIKSNPGYCYFNASNDKVNSKNNQ